MGKTNQLDDSWLVEKYQSGQKSALALLVKRWHIKFCKQAYWYTRDYDSAKDIAQDSWARVIEKIDDLKDTKKFRSWALSIVTNKSIDWIRAKDRFKMVNKFSEPLSYLENNEIPDNSESINEVILAIRKLPENQQIVLKLFYLETNSLNQISKLLKVSKGTVKSRLFYAREKLKLIIKNRNHEQEY